MPLYKMDETLEHLLKLRGEINNIYIGISKSDIHRFMLNTAYSHSLVKGQSYTVDVFSFVFIHVESLPITSLSFIDLCSQSLLASAAASAFTSSFPTAWKSLQWARDAAALLRHALCCGQQTKCNPLPLNLCFWSFCLFSFFRRLLFFLVSKHSCLTYLGWTT